MNLDDHNRDKSSWFEIVLKTFPATLAHLSYLKHAEWSICMKVLQTYHHLTAHSGKNEKEYSWHVPAMKFIGVKQLV